MIYKAKEKDSYVVASIANKLWQKNTIAKLTKEFEEIIKNKNNAIFLYIENEKIIGFAQCSLRNDYVEGCSTTPVGYLEGIYIEESSRNKGYAKQLLNACEQFAKNNNAKEFASDCEINNIESLNFHLKMGFIEINQIRCFQKKL